MIRLATNEEVADWDKLVQANPDGGHIYQSLEWSQVKKFNDWEPVFCMYEAAAYSVAFVLLRKPALMLGTVYYCSKGPGFFRDFQASKEDTSHFEEFLLDLKRFLGKYDDKAILVKLEPELEEDQLDLQKLGLVKASADLQFKATIMVDLDKPEEEIIDSFKQKTRYNIRLAERKGVKVEHRPMNDDGVDLMYELMQATQERAGFFLRPKIYFANYWQAQYDAGQAQFLVATHEGDVLGGVFVTRFGTKSYYKDGGSFVTKRNLMAPYLLQWEAMKWAKSEGATVYDMVAVPPKKHLEDESHHQYGLYQFKRGFNEAVTEFVGCWDLPIHPNKFKMWQRQESYYLKLYAKIKKNLFW